MYQMLTRVFSDISPLVCLYVHLVCINFSAMTQVLDISVFQCYIRSIEMIALRVHCILTRLVLMMALKLRGRG